MLCTYVIHHGHGRKQRPYKAGTSSTALNSTKRYMIMIIDEIKEENKEWEAGCYDDL